jgi:hypothetical protein
MRLAEKLDWKGLIKFAYFSHVYSTFPHTVDVVGSVSALYFYTRATFLVATMRN